MSLHRSISMELQMKDDRTEEDFRNQTLRALQSIHTALIIIFKIFKVNLSRKELNAINIS